MTLRIADDNDFNTLKHLVDEIDGWSLELSKNGTDVWTRQIDGCEFHMVKINSLFQDIEPDTVFDVLHDPDYRKEWDSHMLASEEIGCINVNNDIGYYAMSCPPPLKPRDFVLMRSWLDTGPYGEQMLLSRSVLHKDYPAKKGFVRAISYITGFVIRSHKSGGCLLGYIAHCDPQGKLPPWLVNKVTHTVGPRMVKDLRKASIGYLTWKSKQSHNRKPWRYPEEITCPRIAITDCTLPQQTDILASSSSSNSNSFLKTATKTPTTPTTTTTTPLPIATNSSNESSSTNSTPQNKSLIKERKIPRDSRKLRFSKLQIK